MGPIQSATKQPNLVSSLRGIGVMGTRCAIRSGACLWHMSHDSQYSFTMFSMLGNQKFNLIRSLVVFSAILPANAASWAKLKTLSILSLGKQSCFTECPAILSLWKSKLSSTKKFFASFFPWAKNGVKVEHCACSAASLSLLTLASSLGGGGNSGLKNCSSVSVSPGLVPITLSLFTWATVKKPSPISDRSPSTSSPPSSSSTVSVLAAACTSEI